MTITEEAHIAALIKQEKDMFSPALKNLQMAYEQDPEQHNKDWAAGYYACYSTLLNYLHHILKEWNTSTTEEQSKS